MDELNKFENFSRLQVNKQKGAIFLAGVNDDVKNDILNITGFCLGNLPMKYLGVPLISTRLSHYDCQPLLNKILARIHAWTSRSLSFACILQLLSSVLYNIQMYWCSMFIIPKYTITKIEQIFSCFLWSGKVGNARRAKVSWECVCLPKEEGGLGLRRVKDSNDASVMKHIWNMFYRKDSLWVAWVQRLYLRQGSVWCARTPSFCSWSWRKIIQLRERVRPFIRHKVYNGVGMFLWHDFWNQFGPLLPCFGKSIIYDSAIQRNAHVAQVIGGGKWNWPVASSADLIAIKNSCGDYPLDESKEDTISWTLAPSGVFTVSSAWNQIRPRKQVVNWHNSVWFPQSIRRHAFIVWLVIHDRLDTQDKLLKCGLNGSRGFPLASP